MSRSRRKNLFISITCKGFNRGDKRWKRTSNRKIRRIAKMHLKKDPHDFVEPNRKVHFDIFHSAKDGKYRIPHNVIDYIKEDPDYPMNEKSWGYWRLVKGGEGGAYYKGYQFPHHGYVGGYDPDIVDMPVPVLDRMAVIHPELQEEERWRASWRK